MIAILNYGVGNVFSLECSLRYIGEQSVLTADPAVIEKADRMILPGVGAFGDAAVLLRKSGLDAVLKKQVQAGKPLLGICLGMQLLYQNSCEYGFHEGLGLVNGSIRSLAEDLASPVYKVPQMGWNSLEQHAPCLLLSELKSGERVYFVHSFYAPVTADTVASAEYGGVQVTGVVQSGNVYGMQFHPEKSGEVGLRMLKAFAKV